jgi:predicted GIY-YIG superfamily endonuclease
MLGLFRFIGDVKKTLEGEKTCEYCGLKYINMFISLHEINCLDNPVNPEYIDNPGDTHTEVSDHVKGHFTIYVLMLENGKYYIGKTLSVENRIKQHFKGIGSAWTKKHRPLEVVETIPNCGPYSEDMYTLRYMKQYGIENVRGGIYCQINLPDETIRAIKHIQDGDEDRCYTCGSLTHFTDRCTEGPSLAGTIKERDDPEAVLNVKVYTHTKMCEKCGYRGHTMENCYAKHTKRGHTMENCYVEPKSPKTLPGPGIQDKGETIIKSGKHKNKTYRDILLHEPGYCKWVSKQILESNEMRKFQEWLSTCK